MTKYSDDEKYLAVLNNDISYDGIFYYAVKSTGVFCKPSCKSKTPKRENTLFYHTIKDALNAGFRPCKRCRSELLNFEHKKEVSLKVKDIIDNMFVSDDLINDELSKIGLSYRQMAEIFKSKYSQTPKVYINKVRIKEAKRQLVKTNNTILGISNNIGFNSLSAFYKFFKDNVGLTPNNYRREYKK